MSHDPLARLDSDVFHRGQCVAACRGDREPVFIGVLERESDAFCADRSSSLLDDALTDGVDGSRAAESASEFVDVDEQTVGGSRHRFYGVLVVR